jgi:hypothetical protein
MAKEECSILYERLMAESNHMKKTVTGNEI